MTNDVKNVIDLDQFLEHNADSVFNGWLQGGALCDQIDERYPGKSLKFRSRILELVETLFFTRRL